MTARWKVSVERTVCMSSGVCEAMASNWFALEDDGAHVLLDEVAADNRVIDVAESCPAGAITVVNADDGTVIVP
jgi:ferredoxin